MKLELSQSDLLGPSADELAVEVHGLGGRFAFEDVQLMGELVEGGVDGRRVTSAMFQLHAQRVEVFVARDCLKPGSPVQVIERVAARPPKVPPELG